MFRGYAPIGTSTRPALSGTATMRCVVLVIFIIIVWEWNVVIRERTGTMCPSAEIVRFSALLKL